MLGCGPLSEELKCDTRLAPIVEFSLLISVARIERTPTIDEA